MRKIFMTVFLCLAFANGALAQESQPAQPAWRSDDDLSDNVRAKYERRDEVIQRFDEDGDGFMQKEEYMKGLEERFGAADTNGDGVVSEDEQGEVERPFIEIKDEKDKDGKPAEDEESQKKHKQANNELKKADTNEDGVISEDEYMTYYEKRYEVTDKNGDGQVGVEEFRTDTEIIQARKKKKN